MYCSERLMHLYVHKYNNFVNFVCSTKYKEFIIDVGTLTALSQSPPLFRHSNMEINMSSCIMTSPINHIISFLLISPHFISLHLISHYFISLNFFHRISPHFISHYLNLLHVISLLVISSNFTCLHITSSHVIIFSPLLIKFHLSSSHFISLHLLSHHFT